MLLFCVCVAVLRVTFLKLFEPQNVYTIFVCCCSKNQVSRLFTSGEDRDRECESG